MKLSARKKVANGLVLCLLAPGVTAAVKEFSANVADGLAAFSASDDFDLHATEGTLLAARAEAGLHDDPSGGDPSGGDPSGGDPPGNDPSGGDPSGGDPSGCLPQSEPNQIEFSTSRQQASTSDGSSGLVEVSMVPGNGGVCNDIAVEVSGPESLLPGENGVFLVRMMNTSEKDARHHSLNIAPASQLNIDHYAAVLLSGDDFRSPVEAVSGGLQFSNVRIPAGDMLIVSIDLSRAQVHYLFDVRV